MENKRGRWTDSVMQGCVRQSEVFCLMRSALRRGQHIFFSFPKFLSQELLELRIWPWPGLAHLSRNSLPTKYKIYSIILWAKLLSKVARNHLADVRGNSRTHIPATFATINCSFNVLISSTGSIEVVGMDGWMGEGAVCMSAVECRGTVQLRLDRGRKKRSRRLQ